MPAASNLLFQLLHSRIAMEASFMTWQGLVTDMYTSICLVEYDHDIETKKNCLGCFLLCCLSLWDCFHFGLWLWLGCCHGSRGTGSTMAHRNGTPQQQNVWSIHDINKKHIIYIYRADDICNDIEMASDQWFWGSDTRFPATLPTPAPLEVMPTDSTWRWASSSSQVAQTQ